MNSKESIEGKFVHKVERRVQQTNDNNILKDNHNKQTKPKKITTFNNLKNPIDRINEQALILLRNNLY